MKGEGSEVDTFGLFTLEMDKSPSVILKYVEQMSNM